MALIAGSFTENFRLIYPQSDAFSLKLSLRMTRKGGCLQEKCGFIWLYETKQLLLQKQSYIINL